jgi:FdrA protein
VKHIEVRRGSYVDSVALMQVSKRVASLDGVVSALVAMGTELNLELVEGMGFDVPEASPNEMVVAVEAASDDALKRAVDEVDAALSESSRPTSTGSADAPEPVTVAAAAARSAATVALISTPGQYAFADAVDAVDAGLHTMVFSDNVPVEQEVALKDRARTAAPRCWGASGSASRTSCVRARWDWSRRPGPGRST